MAELDINRGYILKGRILTMVKSNKSAKPMYKAPKQDDRPSIIIEGDLSEKGQIDLAG